jgi:hypothetical protein
LSGCLPIDTRPQARANLGERHIVAIERVCKKIRHTQRKISRQRLAMTPGEGLEMLPRVVSRSLLHTPVARQNKFLSPKNKII